MLSTTVIVKVNLAEDLVTDVSHVVFELNDYQAEVLKATQELVDGIPALFSAKFVAKELGGLNVIFVSNLWPELLGLEESELIIADDLTVRDILTEAEEVGTYDPKVHFFKEHGEVYLCATLDDEDVEVETVGIPLASLLNYFGISL